MKQMLYKTRFFIWLWVLTALFVSDGAAQHVFWNEAPPVHAASSNAYNSLSFAPLAEKAMPGVVTVYTKRAAVGYLLVVPVPYTQEGAGSGVIISRDGYIVTNNHVVAESDSITVVVGVKQKKEYTAKLIGSDPDIDIALIKIDAHGLTALPLGDSDAVRVGDMVAAIGSPFNFPHTFTVGVVSAKGRRLGLGNYDDFIQTDASINSGNSGGPLINMRGDVIGINTLIVSPAGGSVGIGFSTPINLVKMVLPQLKETGRVTRSWLGVTFTPVTDEMAGELGLERPTGAYVSQIVIGGPADKGGVKIGDVILEFNGREIDDSWDLPPIVSSHGVGHSAELLIWRDGKRIRKKVVLEQLPNAREMARMRVRSEVRGDNLLGISARDITAEDRATPAVADVQGVLVVAVESDSPAENNDIRAGDVIVKINKVSVRSASDFQRMAQKLRPGGYVRVDLQRGNSRIRKVFKLPR